MELVNRIIGIILFVVSALLFYKTIYMVIGFFCKKTVYPETEKFAKYAILIPARNEEKVIAHLIESAKKQERFPAENLTIFVVADNCTDQTASVSREAGAVVYERFDEEKKRKGWALEFLVDQIYKDYGKDEFDAFMVFDSDNLLHPNYFYEINKAFQAGHHLLVGYRNTKNFSQNYITAAYGFNNARNMMFLNRPRTKLNIGTSFGGTGILFGKEYLKDGWHYSALTEDCQASLELAASGEKIYFVEDAVLYDEQPHDLKTVYHQRARWEKGILACIIRYFPSLVKRTFKGSFTAYDNLLSGFPFSLVTLLLSLVYPVYTIIQACILKEISFDGIYYLKLIGMYVGTAYLTSVLQAVLIMIREKNNIICSKKKQIFYSLTWFWFDLVAVYFLISSLFYRVKWKTIKHDNAKKLDTMIEECNMFTSNAKSKEEEVTDRS